jgi:hypothetical protein
LNLDDVRKEFKNELTLKGVSRKYEEGVVRREGWMNLIIWEGWERALASRSAVDPMKTY